CRCDRFTVSPTPTAGVPKAALLTAAFFVASSIHIPLPPTSLHLILNGSLGAVLGAYAFPAILVGLFLQAVMFGHGGLTTLGLNALVMGLPAIAAAQLFRLHSGFPKRQWTIALFAFLAGAIGVGLSTLLFVTLAIAFLPAGLDVATERAAILGLIVTNLPLMLIEGVFTALLIGFLQRVKPELVPAIDSRS
ncbi:MAG: cobalt transporter CbiM, partial [Leptolyngbyaceae cyanobacterium SM1_3_5]|nr:cobalt transporter CbiM [Leptolyngbyaceae cyanobacterium SM1_3_5]